MKKTAGFLMFVTIVFLLAFRTGSNEYGYTKIKKAEPDAAAIKLMSDIKTISTDHFVPGSYTNKTGNKINYRLLHPVMANPNTKVPLVIVFHGSGAIGDNNTAQMYSMVRFWALPQIRSKYPAYVLAPQFPGRSSSYVTDNQRHISASAPQPCLTTLLQLVDSLRKTLNIDSRKIYVMGYSMGGSTTINALAARPDLFAAGISIAGIPQFDKLQSLPNIPIWLIHGNKDTENPITSDEHFYNELKGHGKIRFWECDKRTHDDIVSAQVLGEQIPEWLFSKTHP